MSIEQFQRHNDLCNFNLLNLHTHPQKDHNIETILFLWRDKITINPICNTYR